MTNFDYIKRYSKNITIHGKPAELIGCWIDLASYYSDGENAWACQSGRFVNCGPVAEFKARVTSGKVRGVIVGATV